MRAERGWLLYFETRLLSSATGARVHAKAPFLVLFPPPIHGILSAQVPCYTRNNMPCIASVVVEVQGRLLKPAPNPTLLAKFLEVISKFPSFTPRLLLLAAWRLPSIRH